MSRMNNLRLAATPAFPVPVGQPIAVPTLPFAPVAPRDMDPRWSSDERSSLAWIGFYFTVAFIFVRFGVINDLLAARLGGSLYLTYVLGPVALLGGLLSGYLPRVFRLAPSKLWLAMIIWILLGAPFSVWRGGTAETLKSAFQTEFPMFLMIAGTVLTLRQFRTVATTIAFAGMVQIIAAQLYGTSQSSRFAMEFGTLSNPNDLALHLLVTLPFILWMATDRKRLLLVRFLAILFALIGAFFVLRTGSRGGFLAMAGVIFVFVLQVSPMQRLIALMLSMAFIVIALGLLPSSVTKRYTSLWSNSDVESNEDAEAAGSQIARTELLKSSLWLTLRNPVFGVGAGQFQSAESKAATQQGRRGSWHVTHNTYTEVSSEAGIPAFIFLIGTLFGSLWHVRRIHQQVQHNPRLRELWALAFTLYTAFVALAICLFFASQTYRFLIPSFIALAMVFVGAARHEIALLQSVPLEPSAPSPYPVPYPRQP